MEKETKKPTLSRRKLLGLLGLAGGSIVASSLAGAVLGSSDDRKALAAAADAHDRDTGAMESAGVHGTDDATAGTGQKKTPRDRKAPFVRKSRQWVFAIDLKKCDGCESLDGVPECTKACVKGHHVPTGDGGQ